MNGNYPHHNFGDRDMALFSAFRRVMVDCDCELAITENRELYERNIGVEPITGVVYLLVEGEKLVGAEPVVRLAGDKACTDYLGWQLP